MPLGVIHWKLGKATGQGQPIDFEMAHETINELNKRYGSGTHWVVEVGFIDGKLVNVH
tara:strand:+ start:1459 stop:1632 length:174 start_codon:yes stop_codon:yes gene_type:complete